LWQLRCLIYTNSKGNQRKRDPKDLMAFFDSNTNSWLLWIKIHFYSSWYLNIKTFVG
jgi:hypothetical protein